MMKSIVTLILFSFISIQGWTQTTTETDEFPYLGERLEYKISYGGWFPLGTATANIDAELSLTPDSTEYFNATLNARTSWFLAIVKNIDDVYTSQLRKDDLKAIYSEVHTTKGGEKWDQKNYFDYDSMIVNIEGKSNRPDKQRNRSWQLPLNDQTYDIMGSYLFFRDLNWESFQKGDSVMITTLEDHKLWDFGIEFAGMDQIEFNGKKYPAFKVIVLFPVTRTFTEEKAVLFWVIEKDGVKLPVRIEANMRVGRMVCELTEFKGRYTFD